jgi:hypothetical protein
MSRRLQNASMNQVESGGLSQTPVETTSNGERQQLKGLAPEVAQHQNLREIAPLEFNSRRLHHSRYARVVFVVGRLVQSAALPPDRSTPAASTT